jgi:hypothetical protein
VWLGPYWAIGVVVYLRGKSRFRVFGVFGPCVANSDTHGWEALCNAAIFHYQWPLWILTLGENGSSHLLVLCYFTEQTHAISVGDWNSRNCCPIRAEIGGRSQAWLPQPPLAALSEAPRRWGFEVLVTSYSPGYALRALWPKTPHGAYAVLQCPSYFGYRDCLLEHGAKWLRKRRWGRQSVLVASAARTHLLPHVRSAVLWWDSRFWPWHRCSLILYWGICPNTSPPNVSGPPSRCERRLRRGSGMSRSWTRPMAWENRIKCGCCQVSSFSSIPSLVLGHGHSKVHVPPKVNHVLVHLAVHCSCRLQGFLQRFPCTSLLKSTFRSSKYLWLMCKYESAKVFFV